MKSNYDREYRSIFVVVVLFTILSLSAITSYANSPERIHPLRFYDTVEHGDSFRLWTADSEWEIVDAAYSNRSQAWAVADVRGNGSTLNLAGVFDLRDTIDPKATWYDAVQLSTAQVEVQVRVEGEREWDSLFVHAAGTYENWQQRVVSLQPYVGQMVEFRFFFGRGNGLWYLDDIDVLDWATEREAPTSVIVCDDVDTNGVTHNRQAVSCTITATDNLSAIQTIIVTVNGQSVETSLTPLSATSAAVTLNRVERRGNRATVTYYAVDSYGNQEVLHEYIIHFEQGRDSDIVTIVSDNPPIMTPIPILPLEVATEATAAIQPPEPEADEPVVTQEATEADITPTTETSVPTGEVSPTPEATEATTEVTVTEATIEVTATEATIVPTEVTLEVTATEPTIVATEATPVSPTILDELSTVLDGLCGGINPPGVCQTLTRRLSDARQAIINEDVAGALHELRNFSSQLNGLPASVIDPLLRDELLRMTDDIILSLTA